ncbi:unnamed protein product, partial [Staurois parvus]
RVWHGDSSNGRPYRDPCRLWTWQQHEEAVYRGPWQIRGLAAAMGGPVICQHPMSKNSTHQQCVRRPESGTWQSVAMETAAMGGRTGTHERLWTWQQH